MRAKKSSRFSVTERKVVTAIQSVDEKYILLGRKSRNWTRAVKNAVGSVGEILGYEVYASECRFGRNGAWLYDLIWSHEDKEKDFIYRLPLVLESEWDPKDILWDFSKLVVSRADLRVMVFWGRATKKAQKTLDTMLEQIHSFKGTEVGDRYLFCYWTDNPDTFSAELYVVS